MINGNLNLIVSYFKLFLTSHPFSSGHTFTQDKSNKEKIWWRCKEAVTSKCRARAISSVKHRGKITLQNPEHNHSIITKRRKPGALKELRERMLEQPDPSASFYPQNDS
jgi:hypothetical protein